MWEISSIWPHKFFNSLVNYKIIHLHHKWCSLVSCFTCFGFMFLSRFIKVEWITPYSPFTTMVCTWSSANCDSKQVVASPIMYSSVDYLDRDHFSWNVITLSPPSNFPKKNHRYFFLYKDIRQTLLILKSLVIMFKECHGSPFCGFNINLRCTPLL